MYTNQRLLTTGLAAPTDTHVIGAIQETVLDVYASAFLTLLHQV